MIHCLRIKHLREQEPPCGPRSSRPGPALWAGELTCACLGQAPSSFRGLGRPRAARPPALLPRACWVPAAAPPRPARRPCSPSLLRGPRRGRAAPASPGPRQRAADPLFARPRAPGAVAATAGRAALTSPAGARRRSGRSWQPRRLGRPLPARGPPSPLPASRGRGSSTPAPRAARGQAAPGPPPPPGPAADPGRALPPRPNPR